MKELALKLHDVVNADLFVIAHEKDPLVCVDAFDRTCEGDVCTALFLFVGFKIRD